MKLNELTIKTANELLERKEISSVDIAKSCLKRIEETQDLNTFITLNEYALKEAELSDKRRKDGDSMGILDGIPASIKDVIITKDLRTTAASKMLENYIPTYDSYVVKRLKEAGTVILGKNNCDAWAHGASNENSDFGPVLNPHDNERVPGGSSGGSAASVASNQVIFSIASDTGGSIRQPASFCGVVGLKPTYGRVSRYGLISMASSLDAIGPITKTVKDSEIVLEAISGPDKKDSTQSSDTFEFAEKPINGFKIGLPKEFLIDGMEAEVKLCIQKEIKRFEKMGAEIVEISLPHTEYSVPTYYIIQSAEVSSNLSRYDGIRYGLRSKEAQTLDENYFKSRAQGFGEEAKRRIMLGTFTLSAGYYDAYYLKAMKVRSLIRNDFEEAFKGVDCIITPTSPTTAFKFGEKRKDPIHMYLADVFTAGANLAGIPGISLPCGESDSGLPIGMQILTNRFCENKLFNLAMAYEESKEGGKIG